MNTLPKEAINSIMMFLSHPSADLIKQSDVFEKQSQREQRFKIKQHKLITELGVPFKLGFDHAGYQFTNNEWIYTPSMWINPINEEDGLIFDNDMTPEQK